MNDLIFDNLPSFLDYFTIPFTRTAAYASWRGRTLRAQQARRRLANLFQSTLRNNVA